MYMCCEVTLIVRVFFYFKILKTTTTPASPSPSPRFLTPTPLYVCVSARTWAEFKEEPRGGPRPISVLRVRWPPLSQSDPATVRKAVRVTSPRPQANRWTCRPFWPMTGRRAILRAKTVQWGRAGRVEAAPPPQRRVNKVAARSDEERSFLHKNRKSVARHLSVGELEFF